MSGPAAWVRSRSVTEFVLWVMAAAALVLLMVGAASPSPEVSPAGHAAQGATVEAVPLPACDRPPAFGLARNTNGQPGSGGTAVAYHPGGRRITSPDVVAKAPDGRLFHTGFGGWEPTLGLDADGRIAFGARNTNLDPVVIHSSDNGRTWTGSRPCPHQLSLDPYIWLDPGTGRVFDVDIGATVTCPPLSFSDDHGATWTTSTVCGEFDHQTLFGGPPPTRGARPLGYPNVVYFCAITAGIGTDSLATGCSKSLDGGLTFVPTGQLPYPLVPPDQALPPGMVCSGGTGHGIVDRNGTVYLPSGWCGAPEVAISHNEGATWHRVRVGEPTLPVDFGEYAHEAGIAADAAGNLHYVWVDARRRVLVSASTDGGRTWSRPDDVTPPGVHFASLPGIDAGRRGAVAVVFIGTKDRTVDSHTKWNGYLAVTAGALDRNPTWYAAPVNDPKGNPLWIGECGTIRCGAMGDFFDVVIGPDGYARAALVDACPDLVPAHCGTVDIPVGVVTPRGEAILGELHGGPRLR